VGPPDPPTVQNVNELRTPRWVWVLLTVLVIATTAARFIGIDSLLPHAPEPDAVIVWQASYLDRPEGEGVTARSYPATYYPTLLAHIVAGAPGHSHLTPAPPGATDDELRVVASEPYVKARSVIALLSTLLVPFTFLVARRFFSPGWAVCASAFVATSLLATEYARHSRPHAPSAAMNMIGVAAALVVVSRPSVRNYVTAGFAAALAVGTLHNGVFVLPALFLAHCLARGRRWIGLALALTLVALSVWIFYPWMFNAGIFAPDDSGRLDIGGQALGAEHFTAAGFYEIPRGLFGHDPLLVIVAAVGLAVGIVACIRPATRPRGELRAQLLVLLAFPISFTLLWGMMSRVEPRFVVSLVPYAALLATLALRSITRAFGFGTIASIATSLAVLGVPTYACGKHFLLAARADTWKLATRWVEEHTDRNADCIGIPFLYSLPLRERRAGLEALPLYARNNWECYQLALDPSMDSGWNTRWMFRAGMLADRLLSGDEAVSAARQDGVTYALVMVPADLAISIDKTYEGISKAGELVLRIDPSDTGAPQLVGAGLDRQWRAFEFVMKSDRLGPIIEIYRMK